MALSPLIDAVPSEIVTGSDPSGTNVDFARPYEIQALLRSGEDLLPANSRRLCDQIVEVLSPPPF